MKVVFSESLTKMSLEYVSLELPQSVLPNFVTVFSDEHDLTLSDTRLSGLSHIEDNLYG